MEAHPMASQAVGKAGSTSLEVARREREREEGRG